MYKIMLLGILTGMLIGLIAVAYSGKLYTTSSQSDVRLYENIFKK